MAQTYDCVSTLLKQSPVSVFHNLMHLSLEPPPEASTLGNQGHHAIALTAAVCPSQD